MRIILAIMLLCAPFIVQAQTPPPASMQQKLPVTVPPENRVPNKRKAEDMINAYEQIDKRQLSNIAYGMLSNAGYTKVAEGFKSLPPAQQDMLLDKGFSIARAFNKMPADKQRAARGAAQEFVKAFSDKTLDMQGKGSFTQADFARGFSQLEMLVR